MQAKFPAQRLRPPERRRPFFALKTLPAAVALLFAPPGWTVDIAGAAGLPRNGSVVSGSASGSVSGNGNQMTINQTSSRAVLDWASFNIDAGKAVQIAQPNAASAILNRVTGDANPSQILGGLSANGTVMLMNPNGVMFGQNAVVNVGSLIATTGTIDENYFLTTGGAKITGAAGSIVNQGGITAQGAGLVALVAPSVTNQGSISATSGTIALAGATAATVSLNGGLYEFAIASGATGTSVSNAAGASLNGVNLRLGVGDAANLLSGVINLEGVQQASNAIVVNGNAVVLKSALQAPSVSGNSNRVDVYGGARIQNAVDAVVTGGTVNVAAGSYSGNVTITKALTLDGAGAGQTILQSASAGVGDGVTINNASNVTLSDLSIANYGNGLRMDGTSNNVTVNRVAFNNNTSGMRNGTATRADNFRMLNSSITGGQIGVQTYNGYQMVGGHPVATGSFSNALFENVTVDGPTFKGFYLETANNLTLRNVTVTNAGNYGAPPSSSLHKRYGAGIDINLKYDAFNSINFDNVVVKNSGASSGDATAAAVVIKTRGIPGDSSDYTAAPASLQSVNISGGSIEDSSRTGIRFETMGNGSGGQPTVTISGGTQFKNNGQDISVDAVAVDARGAVFVGAADGFAIEDRVTHALDTTGRGLVTWTAGNVYVTQASGSIQRGVDAVAASGTVNVAGGSYIQAATLNVNRGVTLAGSGQGSTVIDARGVSGNGINVTGDNVSLKDFTLYGPSADVTGSYGIKVAPASNASSARLRNFSISNVTSRGAGRAELDLNGVDGALIDRVTADGAPVGNNTGTTQGAGIQLTDSANVTVSNSTTRNNAWGGLALYQANRYYNQQMNNITVAGNNSFTERNPVYLQDESASRNFGTLSIAGFDFAVRNASTAGNNNQYTWLQASQQNAFDYAVNLGSSASSYVQGWNGAQATQDFHVGIGSLLGGGTQALSINTALGNAGNGANIRVGAGTYAENVVVNNPYNFYFSGSTLRSLALNTGASGSGIGGTVTATGTVAEDGVSGFLFNAGIPDPLAPNATPPVRLLGDTTLVTLGSDITINGDIQNAGATANSLSLIAGSGANRGNVHMLSGGTETNALGRLEVVSNQYDLDSTLWVKGYGINALGNVALSNHTLRGQDAGATNTLNAGGDVSGSTISQGAVQVTSGGDVSANVTASQVAVAAVGDVSGTTTSQGNVQVSSSTGDISGNISGNNVVVQAQGNVTGTTTSQGTAQVSSSTGDISGNISGSTVVVQAQGNVSGTMTSQGDVQVSSSTGNISGNISGNNVVVQAPQGDVNVVVVASGSASLAGDSVVANVVAPVVAVAAVGEAQVTGSSSQVTLTAASGSVSGSFGQVTNSGGGLVNVNGRPQGNQQLSSNAENNRVIPSGNNLAEGAPAEQPALQLAQAGLLASEGESRVVRSSPSGAGEALDNGQSVELDMSPKNEREKDQGKE